jgi:hypothetical protein
MRIRRRVAQAVEIDRPSFRMARENSLRHDLANRIQDALWISSAAVIHPIAERFERIFVERLPVDTAGHAGIGQDGVDQGARLRGIQRRKRHLQSFFLSECRAQRLDSIAAAGDHEKRARSRQTRLQCAKELEAVGIGVLHRIEDQENRALILDVGKEI